MQSKQPGMGYSLTKKTINLWRERCIESPNDFFSAKIGHLKIKSVELFQIAARHLSRGDNSGIDPATPFSSSLPSSLINLSFTKISKLSRFPPSFLANVIYLVSIIRTTDSLVLNSSPYSSPLAQPNLLCPQVCFVFIFFVSLSTVVPGIYHYVSLSSLVTHPPSHALLFIGFSFASPAAPPTTGFSFGAPAAPAAPAATTGFSFGTPAAAPTPASTGFSFGAPAAPAPAPTGFSFGAPNQTQPLQQQQQSQQQQQQQQQLVIVSPPQPPEPPIRIDQTLSTLSNYQQKKIAFLDEMIRGQNTYNEYLSDQLQALYASYPLFFKSNDISPPIDTAHKSGSKLGDVGIQHTNSTLTGGEDSGYISPSQLLRVLSSLYLSITNDAGVLKQLESELSREENHIDSAARQLTILLNDPSYSVSPVLDAHSAVNYLSPFHQGTDLITVPSYYQWEKLASFEQRLQSLQDSISSVSESLSTLGVLDTNFVDAETLILILSETLQNQSMSLLSTAVSVSNVSKKVKHYKEQVEKVLIRRGADQYTLNQLHLHRNNKKFVDSTKIPLTKTPQRVVFTSTVPQPMEKTQLIPTGPLNSTVLSTPGQTTAFAPNTGFGTTVSPSTTSTVGFSFGTPATTTAPTNTSSGFGAPASTGFNFGAPAAPAATSPNPSAPSSMFH